MAKKDKVETVPNDLHMKVIEEQAKNYYDGNQAKNAGATKERKAKAALENELANYGEQVVVKINDHMFLEIGFVDGEKEEIDPKKFFENYPEEFWQLVTLPKTVVQAKLGDKVVAQNSRMVKTHDFKIEKHKTDPRK